MRGGDRRKPNCLNAVYHESNLTKGQTNNFFNNVRPDYEDKVNKLTEPSLFLQEGWSCIKISFNLKDARVKSLVLIYFVLIWNVNLTCIIHNLDF